MRNCVVRLPVQIQKLKSFKTKAPPVPWFLSDLNFFEISTLQPCCGKG